MACGNHIIIEFIRYLTLKWKALIKDSFDIYDENVNKVYYKELELQLGGTVFNLNLTPDKLD